MGARYAVAAVASSDMKASLHIVDIHLDRNEIERAKDIMKLNRKYAYVHTSTSTKES